MIQPTSALLHLQPISGRQEDASTYEDPCRGGNGSSMAHFIGAISPIASMQAGV